MLIDGDILTNLVIRHRQVSLQDAENWVDGLFSCLTIWC